jgi:hypothetical protein
VETLTPKDTSLREAKKRLKPLVSAYDDYYQKMVDWVATLSAEELEQTAQEMELFGTANCGWDDYRVAQDIKAEVGWQQRRTSRSG